MGDLYLNWNLTNTLVMEKKTNQTKLLIKVDFVLWWLDAS